MMFRLIYQQTKIGHYFMGNDTENTGGQIQEHMHTLDSLINIIQRDDVLFLQEKREEL